jgi:chemotaxis protein methyltransferase WspC
MFLADIDQQLREAVGLNLASLGSAALECAVRQRQAACGLGSLAAYRRELRGSPAEWQHLVETLVVPETWFFRDPTAFEALIRFARERLADRPGRPLRLLSLPCSTGEEPYSMAIALLDAGIPPAGFHIDAVDISRRALAHGARAHYGPNSFRGSDAAFRRHHFTAGSGGYQLADDARRQVRFQAGNLCADGLLPDAEAYDVVFCRNLLIYFDASALDRAAGALRRLRAPDGLLVVAASEIAAVADRGLRPLGCSSSASGGRSRSRAARPARPWRPGTSPASRVVPCRPSHEHRDSPAGPTEPGPTRATGGLETAAQLADGGSFVEAAARCEALLREHGPSPAVCCLLGLVRDAMGDRTAAARYYRQTLYLDPNHSEALAHYALLLERQGDASRAHVLRARARHLHAARGAGT